MRGYILIASAILGVVLVIAGAVALFAVLPKAIESQVKDNMLIKNDIANDAYQRFVKLSVPLQFKLHFFHVQNPADFNGNLNSLNMTVRGPYVYDEKRYKEELVFNDTTNRVAYRERKIYEFNAAKSKELSGQDLSPSDNISLVHVGLALNPDLIKSFSSVITSIVLTDTVQNLAFDGVAPLLGQSLFQNYEYEKATTPLPERTVDTGAGNIDQLFEVYSYEKEEGKTKFWPTKHNPNGTCALLRGTDGTQFHPNVKDDSTLYVYESMVCRTFKFIKGLTNQEHRGISTLRFYSAPANFEKSDDNSCFCYEDQPDDCPAGLLDLRHCPPADTFQIEMISSQPFYLSNQALLPESGIEHLVAKEDLTWEKYGTILDVEPYTGLVLSARKRVQVNVLLKNGSHSVVMNLPKPKLVAPILWIEEAGDVDEANAQKLQNDLFGPKRTYTGLLIGAMAAGVLILAITGGFAYFKR